MARSIEILVPDDLSNTGKAFLEALFQEVARPDNEVRLTRKYKGNCDILVLYGVGAPRMAQAHTEHCENGRNVVMFDQGYFGRKKIVGYLRMSVNHWHPQSLLGLVPGQPDRWAAHKISLKEDYNPSGPIILVGVPPKSHAYLGELSEGWEMQKYQELRVRFPKTKIIYRPKPKRVCPALPIPTDTTSEIETLLRGSSLVVVRHSNVAVDAVIAGIPFECEDGAAMWLKNKPYTEYNRLDFLQRLAHFQWHKGEVKECWQTVNLLLKGLES